MMNFISVKCSLAASGGKMLLIIISKPARKVTSANTLGVSALKLARVLSCNRLSPALRLLASKPPNNVTAKNTGKIV